MDANAIAPGTARCPAPSVQEVIRADGDSDRQPASACAAAGPND